MIDVWPNPNLVLIEQARTHRKYKNTPQQFAGVCLYLAVFPLGFILFVNSVTRIATFRALGALSRAAFLMLLSLAVMTGERCVVWNV